MNVTVTDGTTSRTVQHHDELPQWRLDALPSQRARRRLRPDHREPHRRQQRRHRRPVPGRGRDAVAGPAARRTAGPDRGPIVSYSIPAWPPCRPAEPSPIPFGHAATSSSSALRRSRRPRSTRSSPAAGGWLGTGPKVARFEEDFAAYKGVAPCRRRELLHGRAAPQPARGRDRPGRRGDHDRRSRSARPSTRSSTPAPRRSSPTSTRAR